MKEKINDIGNEKKPPAVSTMKEPKRTAAGNTAHHVGGVKIVGLVVSEAQVRTLYYGVLARDADEKVKRPFILAGNFV